MGRFKNFSIWRQRLPHWRADEVTYYVTFRHRRELDVEECRHLFRRIQALRDLDVFALAVFTDHTELLARIAGQPRDDLSAIIDKARKKVSKTSNKASGSTLPLFYNESYDHIVRDEAEYEEFCNNLLVQVEALGDDQELVWFAEETPGFASQ
jgi:hypothetical protein